MARVMGTAMLAFSLAGCATMAAAPEAPASRNGGACQADGAQAMVGQLASADVGTKLLATTGAQILRWAPPRSAVTMDFRHDRLTVGYDDDYRITTIACG